MVKLGRYPASWFVLAAVVAALSVRLEQMIRTRELANERELANAREVAQKTAAPAPNLEPAGRPRSVVTDPPPALPTAPAPIDSAMPRALVRTEKVDRSRFAPVGRTKSPIAAAVLSQDGTGAAVLEESGRVTLWDVDLHKQIGSFDTGIRTSPTDRAPDMVLLMPPRDVREMTAAVPYLAIGGSDGRVREWHVRPGEKLSSIIAEPGRSIEEVWGPGSLVAASPVYGGEGKLPEMTPTQGSKPRGPVYDLARSYDSRLIIAATAGGLYSVDAFGSWRLIDTATASHPVQVIFSPTGSHIGSAWSDGEIRVFAVTTRMVIRTMRIKDGLPQLLAFSRDGSLLAVSGAGSTIYVWPTRADAAPVTIRGPRTPLRSMWFAPYDGSLIVTARGDRYLRRLEVPVQR